MTPTLARRLSLGLAVVALGASVYLTVAHYTSPQVLACSASGRVNCEAVTTSAQSSFVGIPVAVLGLVWSLAMVGLTLPSADRWDRAPLARRVATGLGMGFVLWLVYAELFLIGAICLWCTLVHVCTFGLFAIVWSEADQYS
jgi:uncharacterized membrane protein